MMSDQKLLIEVVLPAALNLQLIVSEHNAYRAPLLGKAKRKILCKFPQNACIGGEPKVMHDMQVAYLESLQISPEPKLLLYATSGLLIPKAVVQWCQANLPNCDTVHVGPGTHYIQEDSPAGIGSAINNWMQTNGL